MSSQRPPTSTRASWESNNNEGQHPSDDLLLAYVRRQHIDNWIKLDQHVATCPFCREKCREFQHSSSLISAWTQDKRKQFYPSITNVVMQRAAQESRLSGRERMVARLRLAYKYSLLEAVAQKIMGQEGASGKNQATGSDVSPLSPLTDEPLPGPFAELQRRSLPGGALRSGTANSRRARSYKRPAIALVAVAVLLTLMIVMVVSPRMLPAKLANQPKPEGTMVTVPLQNSTPTPTPKTQPTKTKSTPTTNPEPEIYLCSNSSEEKHFIVRICGFNFTPGERVWLTTNSPNFNQTRTADSGGSVDFQFTINGCKNVPNLIIAAGLSSQKIATLSNSTLDSCSSGRHH